MHHPLLDSPPFFLQNHIDRGGSPLLTAARRRPPVMHDGSVLLAGGRISLQHLAEDFLRPVAHAHVVEAVAVELLGLDEVVTSLEGSLEAFFDETTVLVAPVELFFLLLAHRAGAFAIIPTKRVVVVVVVEDFPVSGPGHQGFEVTAALGDVVLGLEVEIAAETASVFVVAAGEVDMQMPVPVVRYPESKICLQHGSEPALEDLHFAIFQAYREQRHHPVHLRVGGEPDVSAAHLAAGKHPPRGPCPPGKIQNSDPTSSGGLPRRSVQQKSSGFMTSLPLSGFAFASPDSRQEPAAITNLPRGRSTRFEVSWRPTAANFGGFGFPKGQKTTSGCPMQGSISPAYPNIPKIHIAV